MKGDSILNDKCIVEENITYLEEYKNSLIKTEEKDEYAKGRNCAIDCLKDSIEDKIDYLKDVLTWYEDDTETSGIFEVIDRFKGLIWVTMECAKDQDDSLFGKGMADTFREHLFEFIIHLSTLKDESLDIELDSCLYLADYNDVRAMHLAGLIYEEREEYIKAKDIYEKAYLLGYDTVLHSLFYMIDRGFISESELTIHSYERGKVNCPICQTQIDDAPYESVCKICGWGYTGNEIFCYRENEKDDYNLISRAEAKKLFKKGLTIWKEPIPHYKGGED